MSKDKDKTPVEDSRTFLSLHDVGPELQEYANTDPRFPDRSSAARHLIRLGMKHDKKARAKAFEKIGL